MGDGPFFYRLTRSPTWVGHAVCRAFSLCCSDYGKLGML